MGMPLPHRRFTVDEYQRMAETGILAEDDRVELLAGKIVQMSPSGPRHAGCVKRLNRLFSPEANRVVVSVQDPVVLGAHTEPQPDLAVLRHRRTGTLAPTPAPTPFC
jgi:Uma2 family endonuclease